MECPAEAFELLLAKPVAVAGRVAGVVGRSIAFDCQDELARLGWMRSCQVNTKLGAADLRDDLYPFCAEGIIYVCLEVIHGLVSQLSMREKCST